jgi:hypothetical protein
MITIDLVEAEKRFGQLLDPATRTYCMFTDPNGEGEWRPHFQDAGVIGYRLYPARPDTPPGRYRKPGRKITVAEVTHCHFNSRLRRRLGTGMSNSLGQFRELSSVRRPERYAAADGTRF